MSYFVTFIRLLWNRCLNWEALAAVFSILVVYQFVIKNDTVYDFIGRILAKIELRMTGHYDDTSKNSDHVIPGQTGKVIWESQKDNVGIFAVQGRRPHMEDRFNEISIEDLNISLYGVFDGHGGEFAAEFVEKSLFRKIIMELLKTETEADENLTEILKNEIMEVDRQLLNAELSTGDVSGTTLVLAMLRGQELIVANVGDSRGVLCDGQGRAVPLTHDHKPNSERERKRIEESGGFVTFNGVWRAGGVLATSRALGDLPLKTHGHVCSEPDIETFDLRSLKPKFMILATDGLWDVFSNEDAVAFVSERLHESHFGAKSLVLQAFYRGSPDNITVMIVKFPAIDEEKRREYEDEDVSDDEYYDAGDETSDDVNPQVNNDIHTNPTDQSESDEIKTEL